MEVKIKQGNEMLDATIEMVDGVMVVSPKVELFEPKNGDIVTTEGGAHIFLCKEYFGEGNIYAYFGYNFIKCSWFMEGKWGAERYATEEEKKKLFDKLKEEGYEFDFEKKELVKLKWKPVLCEVYYRPQFYQGYFEICKDVWNDSISDEIFYDKYWCFKTEKECQELVDKLNQAIEGVKP